MQPKLEKILLNNDDAITTSLNLMAGMSPKSYQALAEYQATYICGFSLAGVANSGEHYYNTDDYDNMLHYYDENGLEKSVRINNPLITGNSPIDYWFHYDSNGHKWQICLDESHHNTK